MIKSVTPLSELKNRTSGFFCPASFCYYDLRMKRSKETVAARLFPGLRTKLKTRRGRFVLLGLFLLLIFIILLSADKGAVEISQMQIFAIILKKFGVQPLTEFTLQQESTLLDIRLPRIALGLLVG